MSRLSDFQSHRADGVQRAGRRGAVQGAEHELGEGACGHQHQLHDLRLFEAEVWYLLTGILVVLECCDVYLDVIQISTYVRDGGACKVRADNVNESGTPLSALS